MSEMCEISQELSDNPFFLNGHYFSCAVSFFVRCSFSHFCTFGDPAPRRYFSTHDLVISTKVLQNFHAQNFGVSDIFSLNVNTARGNHSKH